MLTAHIVAGLLATQALTGWCYERTEKEKGSATVATHRCSGCGDEHQSGEPGEEEAECRGVCVYVGSTGLQLDSLQPGIADCIGCFPSQLGNDVLGGRVIQRWPSLNLHGPPLRLHLLHQILLV